MTQYMSAPTYRRSAVAFIGLVLACMTFPVDAGARETTSSGATSIPSCPVAAPSPAPTASTQSSAAASDQAQAAPLVLVASNRFIPAGETQQVKIADPTADVAILNTNIASVTTAPGDPKSLVVKGEIAGHTTLQITAKDGSCKVIISIDVTPPKNRFVLTVGVGSSTVPKRTINVVASSPTLSPAGTPLAGTTTVNRSVLTEDSTAQDTSFSALGHIRLTDHVAGNYYGTLGTLGDGSIVYGFSYGVRDSLFVTIARHSANVTDFASGYSNNAIVPAGVTQVTLTRRQAGVFISFSIPLSVLGGSGFLGTK
jgi:hypothetical protein